MILTTYDKGMIEGQRRMAHKILERRFGPLSPEVQQRLNELAPEKLDELGSAIVDAPSLQAQGL